MADPMKEKTPYLIMTFEEPITERKLDVVFGYVRGHEMISLFNGDNLIAIIGKKHLEMMLDGGWQECSGCKDDEGDAKHNHGTDWDKYLPGNEN